MVIREAFLFLQKRKFMKQNIFLMLSLIVFGACQKQRTDHLKPFSKVEVENLYEDSLLSIRAIDILKYNSLSFAANEGVFGLYNPKTSVWQTSVQKYDTTHVHFRAAAHTSGDFFMLSIDTPALLYKTGHKGEMELVYKEQGNGVFYDAMTFWNDQEGMAIGDPTADCMSIIITRDGGSTWTKLSCDDLPKAKEGEAAFAASNTNIAIVGDHAWVVTGGKASRILHSQNKGKTWEVFETPIVQGEETTGIYSIDFYDELNGFAIGGDYTKPEENAANKMRTKDGGKTWELVAENQNPGYRSCVQYIPQ